MKKIITIVLLCLTSIAFSQALEEEENKEIEAEVSIGKYTDCLRPGGICTFNVSSLETIGNSLVHLNKDNTITIRLNRTKISESSQINLFREEKRGENDAELPVFKMLEDFILEKETIIAIDPDARFTKIIKSNYPIIKSENYYTITLKLE